MNELNANSAQQLRLQALNSNGKSLPDLKQAVTAKQELAEKPSSDEVVVNSMEVPEETQPADQQEQIKQAVTALNDYVQQVERKLNFQLDEDSGDTIIRVFDASTEELIRQIPSEEALELASKISQNEPPRLFRAQI